MTVLLDRHEGLDLELYARIVGGEGVEIADAALERVARGRELLLELVAGGATAYGVTTGLGYLHGRDVVPDEREALQRALVIARAAGLGPPLLAPVVRGVMVLRLNGFLSGQVGVGVDLCRFLAERVNDGWSPVVPNGPYGAAGEIGPLAHLFQTFVGEGRVQVGTEEIPAAQALAARGAAPFELGLTEGLALVNGSPFATALGIELAGRFRPLLDTATVAAALEVVVTGASTRPYARRIGEYANDPAQARVHERLLGLFDGEPAHEDLPQSPVSLRVVPQVHGAALDLLQVLEERLARRLSAVTDSPLVLAAREGEPEGLYASGNFHAAGPALLLDALVVAIGQVANLAEKRLHRLLDARFSGLPEQLAVEPGRQAGVISLHKAAVGLVAEARLLAAPASVHALDTSSGQEDVQAFTFLAAERTGRALDVLEATLACELVALRQAAYLRGLPIRSPVLAEALDLLAAEVEPLLDDRTLSPDVERVRALVRSGGLGPALE